MTLRKRTILKNGNKVLSVETAPDERLIKIGLQAFYRLGAQTDMIFPASAIDDMQQVSWCPVSQKWMDV